jgi:hypothetical protein
MSGVRDRKRSMVDGLIQLHLDNYKRSRTEIDRNDPLAHREDKDVPEALADLSQGEGLNLCWAHRSPASRVNPGSRSGFD